MTSSSRPPGMPQPSMLMLVGFAFVRLGYYKKPWIRVPGLLRYSLIVLCAFSLCTLSCRKPQTMTPQNAATESGNFLIFPHWVLGQCMKIKSYRASVVDGSALYCVLRMQKIRTYQDLTSSSEPPRVDARAVAQQCVSCE